MGVTAVKGTAAALCISIGVFRTCGRCSKMVAMLGMILAAQEKGNCSFVFLVDPTQVQTVDFRKVKIAVEESSISTSVRRSYFR